MTAYVVRGRPQGSAAVLPRIRPLALPQRGEALPGGKKVPHPTQKEEFIVEEGDARRCLNLTGS